MPRKREPRWITRPVLDAIHDAQLREHGGMPGVRDDGLLEAALARPRHKFLYSARPDLATLAAAYVFGLAKNHGFVDGNRRTEFMAAYVFLGMNGQDLDASEPDVVVTVHGAAAGQVSEAAIARWFRNAMRNLDK